jgi:hypothetical protein
LAGSFGLVYRRAVDLLRTATEPLTAREIAERVLAAANIKRPGKAALADLIGTINSSLRNHAGKRVQRTNEGSPDKWRLASNQGKTPPWRQSPARFLSNARPR